MIEKIVLEGYSDFLQFRRYVLNSLNEVDMYYGHKSYEGTFEILLSYPNYFDENCGENPKDKPDCVRIELHCYVLGPARHYFWTGNSIKEALAKCKKDVCKWIQEEREQD